VYSSLSVFASRLQITVANNWDSSASAITPFPAGNCLTTELSWLLSCWWISRVQQFLVSCPTGRMIIFYVWPHWGPSRFWTKLEVKSKSKLLCDWSFTANQFVLTPIPLKLKTWDILLTLVVIALTSNIPLTPPQKTQLFRCWGRYRATACVYIVTA
jgi:hypothetical protein